MNVIDILFILLLLAGLALGFFQGTIKLVVAIVAFYVGIVLASLYFQIVGNWLRIRFNSSVEVGQLVGFALILLISFLLLTVAGLYTFRYAKFPASFDFVDRIVGSLLGLLLAALFLGMFAILLSKLFIEGTIGDLAALPVLASFQNSVRASFLLPYSRDFLLPLIYGLLRPILPREAEIIFITQ